MVYICVSNATIFANIIDQNRYDIAGSGKLGTVNHASHNIVFRDRDHHLFDIHSDADRKDNTKIVGTSMRIGNNYFVIRDEGRTVTIRGTPEQSSELANNIIIKMNKKIESAFLRRASRSNEKRITPFVSQLNGFGKIRVTNNKVINF